MSPAWPLSLGHITTYGQGHRMFSPIPDRPGHLSFPDSPACVWTSQVEGFLGSPPPQRTSEPPGGLVCVQVPEADLAYWLFLQLSVWKIIQ